MDIESDAGFVSALEFQGNTSAADKHLAVRFYTDEVKDEIASAKEARPVFKTVECVEIQVPGDRSTIIRGPIKGKHPDPRIRFPEAYAKFKRGHATQVNGTLLREWGLMPRSEALGYQAQGVYTVEQLAELNDQACRNIPGSVGYKRKAKDFLDMAKGQAPLAAARAEAEKAHAEIAALREQMQEMARKLEDLQGTQPEAPKRRGRRPKSLIVEE